MAEICCAAAEGGAAESSASAVVLGEASSRAARRRRMEIRRHRIIADADAVAPLPEEADFKRRRVEKEEEEEDGSASDSSLYSNSKSVSIPPGSEAAEPGPRYGVTSVRGRRRDMEDSVSVQPDFLRRGGAAASSAYHFFGVFDGHGCSHVAATCKDRMHEIAAEEIGPGPSPAKASEWNDAMERTFVRADAEVAVAASAGSGAASVPSCRCELQTPKCDHVGSTAVVAVVGPESIVVANCGDSRAVLCRGGAAVPLSSDHKPDRPDELDRIEAAGGRVIYWDGARVLGVLAMSRAIGDGYLKPFVTAEPEVTVTEREAGDECLILASDGLWDVVTNEMACYIVGMCLRGRAPGDVAGCGGGDSKACADAALLLTKLALARGSMDNVSVVVVDLRRNL